jgi:hypothetical protein
VASVHCHSTPLAKQQEQNKGGEPELLLKLGTMLGFLKEFNSNLHLAMFFFYPKV